MCYLRLLLSARAAAVRLPRACADMDEWGYSFRLGSTRAGSSRMLPMRRAWLLNAGIIDAEHRLTGHCRL